jgi:signal transduction histidine kinase
MAPLMAGDRAIGVLKYENRIGGQKHFDKHDERLIDMVAVLVTNLVISQRIERNRYDRILPVISSALVSHFDKPSSYEPLLETCRGVLSADVCSLFLLDEQGNLMLECIVGIPQWKKEKLRGFGYQNYRAARGLTPWILRKGSPFNVRSYPDLRGRSESHHLGQWDATIYDGRPEELFRSLYSVPLIIGNEPIGVFKVENKNISPYYFTESDERLFDLIGRLIAVGVRYATTRENEQYLLQMARNVELGFLAAGISHEFNGYLQRMLSTARVAKDKCRDDAVTYELDQIVTDISKATKIIDIFHFHTLRTPVSGAESVVIDQIVEDIVGISRARFAAHSVEIRYVNHGVVTARLYTDELHSILINLINNAFDSVAEAEGQRIIELVVRPEHEDRFTIEVIDSGAGVPTHVRNVVFAPFYTTKPHGMGIGLYLVQRIVNNMGWKIALTSPNDRGGATFCVTLPRNIAEEES